MMRRLQLTNLSLMLLLFVAVVVDVASSTTTNEGDDETEASCLMCGRGKNQTLKYPNRVVPFFNLPGGVSSPRCYELAAAAKVANKLTIECSLVEAQANFCGCHNVSYSRNNPHMNHCHLCPNGTKPDEAEFITPSRDTCTDLDWYTKHQSKKECDTLRVHSIQEFARMCGCPDVDKDGDGMADTEPSCSWCPTQPTLVPPQPNKRALPNGQTCGELYLYYPQYYTSETCADDESKIEIVAARCGCPGMDFPVCPIQQNPHLCTDKLLDLIIATPSKPCECASFCGDEFMACHDFPGKINFDYTCPNGEAYITGCNRALATVMRLGAKEY